MSNKGVGIVTGAAGGMGAPSAMRLAKAGHPLILCDLDPARLEEVAAPLRAEGTAVEILAGSVADADFGERLLTLLAGRPIGAVIHTAGVSPTRGDAAAMFAVNYDASLRLAETILPHMQPGACAVMVASSSGHFMSDPKYDAALRALGPSESAAGLIALTPDAGPAYALSKRGVHRLVERQAKAFGARGARIASISPGLIDTAMGRAEADGSERMAYMLSKTPLGRYGTGDEIASVAAFLCSPDASYISGVDIEVDGGTIAGLAQ